MKRTEFKYIAQCVQSRVNIVEVCVKMRIIPWHIPNHIQQICMLLVFLGFETLLEIAHRNRNVCEFNYDKNLEISHKIFVRKK